MSNTISDNVRWELTIWTMVPRKDSPLAFRIPRELKEELQRISERESRSLSQVCEIILRIGADQYRKEGSRFLERYLDRKKLTQ
jgi:hypothetical protein